MRQRQPGHAVAVETVIGMRIDLGILSQMWHPGANFSKICMCKREPCCRQVRSGFLEPSTFCLLACGDASSSLPRASRIECGPVAAPFLALSFGAWALSLFDNLQLTEM